MVKQKPRNNPILSMIYAIDNSLEIEKNLDMKDNIKSMDVDDWIYYISEYHREKDRAQLDRINLGHYGAFFTPDILSGNFKWEKI